MILKRILVIAATCLVTNIAVSQTCSYNVTLTSNGATCLETDTIKLASPSAISSITWYSNGDSIGISNLAPATIAGRKTGNGSGSTPELLYEPYGIHIDRSGNIFIADVGNRRIQKWAPGATQGTTIAGGYDYDDAVPSEMKIYSPYGVGFDSSGNFYTIDGAIRRIQKWTPGATSGITIADGTANSQLLGNPTGIYVTKGGTLYISDYGNNRVQKWLPGATSGITVAGGHGFGNADNQLAFPAGVFVDERNETVYVCDLNNHRVQKWLAGATSGIIVAGGNGQGNAANQLNSPWGIFVTDDETVYVADRSNHRVQMWAAGAVSGITVAGGNGSGNLSGQLAAPTDVFLDTAGNIFISEAANHRIQKWSPGSTSGITVAGSAIGSAAAAFVPGDVITDNDGNLYISDAMTNSVKKYAPGSLTGVIVAGGNGRGNAANQFDQADDIFIDSSNTLYVCDMNNHRVQKWISGSSSGITVAGGNGSGSNPNQLNQPSSVFADGSGAVFIADRNNNRVQMWLPGAVSGVTVAGGNGMGSNANQLFRPDDVFVDSAGNLYIADAFNHRIQKWAPGAVSGITVAGGGPYAAGTADKLNNPKSIYVDGSSNIFIADYHNHRIQKWHEGDDSAITVAGSTKYYGSLSDQMLAPVNVHKDKNGNLFIVDAFNTRAQKWPNVVDSTFISMSPGNYTAVVKGKSPVCMATGNAITVNTGYTYQFTGNGNWSDTSNWIGGNLPLATLPACSKIIVSPEGNCILDVPQTISAGANLTVVSGTNFVINGNLTIQ